jgi:hypothetical protein
MKKPTILLIAFASALFFTGCATPKSTIDLEASKREYEAKFSDRTIEIHTLPYGAMIDLNGDVVGITPCTLELKRCYQNGWPLNGNPVQILRARFWDGSSQEQHFFTTATPPKKVAFIHPHAHLYPNPKPLALLQK